MMMLRMVMLPRCYRSEYSEVLGFWIALRALAASSAAFPV